MRILKGKAFAIVAAWMLLVSPVLAQAVGSEENAKANLRSVYESRQDLQALFAEDGTLRSDARLRRFATVEEWAGTYGYKEFPELLGWYAPAEPEQPAALRQVAGVRPPIKIKDGRFAASSVSSSQYLVLDDDSGKALVAKDAEGLHPIASITKLMTAIIAVDRGVPMSKVMAMTGDDELGGARLQVRDGSKITLQDLMYGMLVGSANNAASAVARSTGLSKAAFVEEMNGRAAALGLGHTVFADPSGLNPGNVSTPAEIAALAREAWKRRWIRRMTSTAKVTLTAGGKPHTIKNTNTLLTDPDNGLTVLGGKTGYLEESKWNLVVRMRDASHPALVVVVFGADDRHASFRDAEALARWTWAHYSWAADR